MTKVVPGSLLGKLTEIDTNTGSGGDASAAKQDEQTNLLTIIANASLPDKETPYITFRCNTAFTGASVNDVISGILTINTVTNAFVSNTPLWFNFTTQQPITVTDTSKLTAIAVNALTSAELATMTLGISAANLPLPTGAATQATLADILAKLIAAPATETKQDTGNTLLGVVTETAPSTDTASSGINGRLQRIAQRLTSLIALFPSSLGTKTAANSLAVTLASDGTAGLALGAVGDNQATDATSSWSLIALAKGLFTKLVSLISLQTVIQTATQAVAVAGTSAQSSVVGSTTTRVVLTATTNCWVSIGSNPTAAAHGSNSFYLAAGSSSYPMSVTGSTSKIAVIQDSAAGYLSILESV